MQIVLKSLYVDCLAPLLCQRLDGMVTLLIKSDVDIGTPLVKTKRGKDFLCTYNGLYTLPERFKQEVDAYPSTFVYDGSYHVPFVSMGEFVVNPSRSALKAVCARRCALKTPFRDGIFDEIMVASKENRQPHHMFVVHSGVFHVVK